MFKKQTSPDSRIGKKVYFEEKRGDKAKTFYIGTIIGLREMHRTTTPVFGIGEKKEWDDTSLLIETSDRRKVQAWQLDTFLVEAK